MLSPQKPSPRNTNMSTEPYDPEYATNNPTTTSNNTNIATSISNMIHRGKLGLKLSKSHEEFYLHRTRERRGTVSLAVTELVDEDEIDFEFLQVYFDSNIIPLANKINDNSGSNNNNGRGSGLRNRRNGRDEDVSVLNPLHGNTSIAVNTISRDNNNSRNNNNASNSAASHNDNNNTNRTAEVELVSSVNRHTPRYFTAVSAPTATTSSITIKHNNND